MKNIPGKKYTAGLSIRLLSALLVFCMLAAFVPGMEAYAASYNLWVGGTRVTSDNAGSLLSGKASYNASTNTLTLNGAAITKGTSVYDSAASAAVYSSGDLNIVLKGSSTVNISGYAVAADGNLHISGNGTLTATTTGDMFSSMYSAGKTTIAGGTITLNASGSESIGLWAANGLTVNGGSLIANASGNNSCGVLSDAAASVSGGSLTTSSSGAESWGLAVFGKLSLSGGSLKSTAAGTSATGIFASSFDLSNGSFEASGTECAVFLDGAKSITVGSGYSLNEGASAPGSAVSAYTNTASASGTFLSKNYLKAADNTSVIRLGGNSRCETALTIAANGWTSAETVVLATDNSFADALAGVPLAYALDAPILLINSKTVDESVLRQLSVFGTKNVYLLGGEVAISSNAAKQLTDNGYKVTRIYGQDRFATAIAIANEFSKVSGKKVTSVFFASGTNYPDALAGSSVAALTGAPILYAPAAGSLDSSTAGYLSANKIDKAVVLGGEVAIGANIYSSIQKQVGSIERVFGNSRYETAANIIKKYSSVFTGSGIAVATGTNYPDALAGAALAAKRGIAVMLVPPTLTAGSEQTKLLKSLVPKGSNIYVFGGPGAVSEQVVSDLLK